MNKFNNKKIEVNGIKYDSKLEYEYHEFLKTDSSIREIILQPRYTLLPSYELEGKLKRGIEYVADFEIWYVNGDCEIIDVKGFETADFKLKKKMFEAKFKRPLKCVTLSKIDGGWIEIEELRKARNKRNRERQKAKGQKIAKDFVPDVDGVRDTGKGETFKGIYGCKCGDVGKRFLQKTDRKTNCHKCKEELTVIHYDEKDPDNNYWRAY